MYLVSAPRIRSVERPHRRGSGRARLRVTYLIQNVQGVTGGNQTFLHQANALLHRGHAVTIVARTARPAWFSAHVDFIEVPASRPMASCVPASDAVISTHFINTAELLGVAAPVKLYFARGDQYVFSDPAIGSSATAHALREVSRRSYQLPGVWVVPNSRYLARTVEQTTGRAADAILPVCVDAAVFRPLERAVEGSMCRILVVGPDTLGTDLEPQGFKGMGDIREGLARLAERYRHFTPVRISNTRAEIFGRFPCEYYVVPTDEMKTFLYGTAHILIYASHYDSCPRPPLEAMAAGCAVVCTDTPGALEYCRDGENCLLVPIKSPGRIAEAVERVILDTPLRTRLIAGGLATARQYPPEREWDVVEALLYRFLAASSPKGTSAKEPPRRPAGADPHAVADMPIR